MFPVQRRQTFFLLQESSSLKTKNKVWFILSPRSESGLVKASVVVLDMQNKMETFEMPHEELSIFYSGQEK